MTHTTRKKKNESLYTSLPVAQARIGLFDGLEVGPFKGMGAVDVGVRLGYIPKISLIESGSLYGGDLRIGILKDGLVIPGVALSITYNTLSDLKLRDEDWKVGMDIKTTGVKILVGKDLPLLHPYGAIGYEMYSFKTDYKVGVGTTTIVEDEYKHDDSLFRILAGCDITVFPFVKLGAEYNLLGDESIYALSLRAGF